MKYSQELAVLVAMNYHYELGHVEKLQVSYRPKQLELSEGILQPTQG